MNIKRRVIKQLIMAMIFTLLLGLIENIQPVQAVYGKKAVNDPQAEAFSCADITDVPESECQALVELYNSTGGPSWTNNNGWLQPGPIFFWYGISASGGHVGSITLQNNNLVGTLSLDFSVFPYLLTLRLADNQLNGDLSAIMASFPPFMNELSLSNNNFSGSIPAETANLTKLSSLSLSENQLTGDMTTIIGNLPASVRFLFLDHNQFTGTIPPEISNLTLLRTLHLEENQLAGDISTVVSSIPDNLWTINLAGNQFTGDLSAIISGLPTNMHNLNFHNNDFYGSIPAELSSFTQLTTLDLGKNQLSGDMSLVGGYFPAELDYLDLSMNDFTGSIPSEFTSLTQLLKLYLGHNQITGDLFDILGNLPNQIAILYLNDNEITGTIPGRIGNFHNLWSLDLGENQLSGDLTTIIDYLPTLDHLDLSSNNFTGTIPVEISNLNLYYLDLSNNQVSGSLSFIGYLNPYIKDLYLNGNNFYGSIPDVLPSRTYLQNFNIADNPLLGGTLPYNITNLEKLRLFDFSNTHICEPDFPSYLTWKAGVTEFYSAGRCILTNSSFETYIPVGWQDGRQIEHYDGPDCGSGNAHSGECAQHIHGDGSNKRVFMRYKLSGVTGDNFHLSIYLKGSNIPAEGGAYIKATLFYKDGTQEIFKENLDNGNLGTWQQFNMHFSAAKDYKRINLDLFYKKASGTLWLDDISLTRNGGAELLGNTSFEIFKPDDWIYSVELSPDEGPDCYTDNANSDYCSMHFVGDTSNKRLLMRVRQTGNAGDPLSISIFRKGLTVPAAGGAFVKVEIFYTDGTSEIFRMDLDTGDMNVWQILIADFTAAKDYKRFNINLFYRKNSGTLWLDDISLMLP